MRPIAANAGVTIDAVALAAVLAQPWADVVLSGAATVDHLHANIAALAVDLTPDDRAALSALAEEPADYWTRRSDLAWS
jgi:aryl-alcohol dehydrogenase-like predicted oxidoreductase